MSENIESRSRSDSSEVAFRFLVQIEVFDDLSYVLLVRLEKYLLADLVTLQMKVLAV